MGFFWGEVSNRFVKTCRLWVEELRAWAMAEVTQDFLEWAEHDWVTTECSGFDLRRSSEIPKMS
jgi:hypothetical protein